MNKKVKSLLLVLCAIVFFAAGIFATLAYLQDTTKEAINTISVGDVHITMDEARVDEYGEQMYKANADGTPTEEKADRIPNATDGLVGNAYTLIPGEEYIKDPTIHIAAGKEPAYIFVKVLNPISSVEVDAEYTDLEGNEAEGTIAEQMAAFGWVLVNEETGLYVYGVKGDDDKITPTEVDTKDNSTKDLPVFQAFKVNEELDNEVVEPDDGTKIALDDYQSKTIQIRAYAIQARGVEFEKAKEMADAALVMTSTESND